jgi:hypothetical protein
LYSNPHATALIRGLRRLLRKGHQLSRNHQQMMHSTVARFVSILRFDSKEQVKMLEFYVDQKCKNVIEL